MIDPRFFTPKGSFSLQEIANVLKGRIVGNADLQMKGLGSLETTDHQEGILSFFSHKKYASLLENTKVAAVVTTEALQAYIAEDLTCIIVSDVDKAFIQAAQLFYDDVDGIKYFGQKESIHPSVRIGKNCTIAPTAIILPDVVLGDNVVIGPYAVIGHGVTIGAGSRIFSGAKISHTLIGKKVTIQQNVSIGQPGFGFVIDEAGYLDLPQLGRVIIGDNVSIGAHTNIARGRLEDTCIGDGTHIDALVQIAHGVQLGKGCVIVAQVGIAGSTKVGDYTMMGGQVGLTEHLNIGRGVRIAAQSGVLRDIPDGVTVGGSPALPVKEWQRQCIALSRLVKKK